MYHFFEKWKGSISVFLILILLPTVVFAGMLTDGTRIFASRTIVSGAGDLAMNAALSQYEPNLKNMYALFAMDEKPSDNSSTYQQYFEESINANSIAGGDQKSVAVNLFLENGCFDIREVSNTEIYETQVMLNQIMDYMKYRAPVVIAEDGVLSSLTAFSGMNKAADAVKKQLKFENELADLQDDFEDLYEKLKIEKKLIYTPLVKEKGLENAIEDAKKYEQTATILTAAYINLNAPDALGAKGGDIKAMMQQFNTDAGNVHGPGGATVYSQGESALTNYDTLVEMIQIKNGITDPGAILDGYEDLEEDDEDYDEYLERKDILDAYLSNLSVIDTGKGYMSSCADKLYKLTADKINTTQECADQGEKYTTKIIKLLEKIRDKNSEGSDLKNAFHSWGDSIGSADPAYTSGMQEEYNDYERLMDVDQLEILLDHTKQNHDYYEEARDKLQLIKYCSNIVYTSSGTGIGAYSSTIGGIVGTGIQTKGGIDAAGAMAYDQVYENGNIIMENKVYELELDKFYEFVKETCEPKGNHSKEEKKQKIKETNDNLDVSKDTMKDIEKEDSALNESADLSNVPTVWLSQVGSTENSSAIKTDGGQDDNKSRKKASNAAMESIDGVGNQLSGLTEANDKISVDASGGINSLAKSFMEPFYISCYENEMFSCNVSDKLPANKQKSLTGMTFSKDNNALYRSEQEYMLWGNHSQNNNVRFTKYTLFGIRYALNTIYAFSNATLRAEADVIAEVITMGAASFALPLIRSIILLGFVAIQTQKDMKALLEGKDVVVYHTNSTWGRDNYSAKPSLNYKQYMFLFLLIHNIGSSGKTKTLARTGDCIELNVLKKDSSATMKTEFTMVAIGAKVSLKTMFIPKLPSYDSSFSNVDTSAYDIKYHSVLSY